MCGCEMNLYVIAEGIDGPCKIGYADRVANRVSSLQSGNPRKLTLYHSQPCAEYRMAERLAHSLAGYQNCVLNEWFSITVERAIAAVREACDTANQTRVVRLRDVV